MTPHDTSALDQGLTLNEITARYPDLIEVFNRFGVDICCGGDATLAEAAERDGVELRALEAAVKTAADAQRPRQR